jgi:acyl carrier protein
MDSYSNDLGIQQKVIEIVRQTLKLDNLGLETKFEDTGADSIAFIKTVVALEDEFNIEFEDDYLYTEVLPTIRTMVGYIKSKSS